MSSDVQERAREIVTAKLYVPACTPAPTTHDRATIRESIARAYFFAGRRNLLLAEWEAQPPATRDYWLGQTDRFLSAVEAADIGLADLRTEVVVSGDRLGRLLETAQRAVQWRDAYYMHDGGPTNWPSLERAVDALEANDLCTLSAIADQGEGR